MKIKTLCFYALCSFSIISHSTYAVNQDQSISEKKNRLNKMVSFIVKNKACLSGNECSPRFSLLLNFLLGISVGWAQVVIPIQITGAIATGTIPIGQVLGPLSLLAPIPLIPLSEIVVSLGYDKFINSVKNEVIDLVSCIRTGSNCSPEQRRYLFFRAGQFGGLLGIVATVFLIGTFSSDPERILAKFGLWLK